MLGFRTVLLYTLCGVRRDILDHSRLSCNEIILTKEVVNPRFNFHEIWKFQCICKRNIFMAVPKF